VFKQLRPDVIQAHDPHAVAVASLALSIAAPSPRPPLLASRRVEFRIARNSFSRWKYGQVDCFIANSGPIRDRLVADGIPARKTTLVNEGVDVERIVRLRAANVHAEFYLPTHAPVIGNVAALVPHKGQHHLIDAAALVVRQVPDARFVIVGEGELRRSLEEQIHHRHLERHVFLAGFRLDVLELTKGFDLFAMSSVSEGMCTALVGHGGVEGGGCDARRRYPGRDGRRRDRLPRAAARPPRDGRPHGSAAQGRWPAGEDGSRRAAARAGALHRRADGRGDRGRLRAAGRHRPRSGQWESRCARLKPQAFIIPT
jgi:hypothetical protein